MFSAINQGHSHPKIIQAMTTQLQKGIVLKKEKTQPDLTSRVLIFIKSISVEYSDAYFSLASFCKEPL